MLSIARIHCNTCPTECTDLHMHAHHCCNLLQVTCNGSIITCCCARASYETPLSVFMRQVAEITMTPLSLWLTQSQTCIKCGNSSPGKPSHQHNTTGKEAPLNGISLLGSNELYLKNSMLFLSVVKAKPFKYWPGGRQHNG